MARSLLLWVLCSACASAGPLSSGSRLAATPAAGAPATTDHARGAGDGDKVVVSGHVEVVAADVDRLVHTVRARVQAAGGRVMNEEVSGSAREPPRALVRVRLPPAALPPFLDWLAAE